MPPPLFSPMRFVRMKTCPNMTLHHALNISMKPILFLFPIVQTSPFLQGWPSSTG